MVEEAVWVKRKYVRSRLRPDELWLIYRLIDNQYWLLREHPHPLWKLEKVSRFRRKILRLVNRCRTPKISDKPPRETLLNNKLRFGTQKNRLGRNIRTVRACA